MSARSALRLSPWLPLFSWAPVAAAQDCGVLVTDVVAPPALVYDPFAFAPPVERTVVEVAAEQVSRVAVTFETEAGLTFPVPLGTSGVRLTADALLNGQWQLRTPGRFEAQIGPEGDTPLGLDLTVDGDAVAPPGRYRERIFLRFENLDTGIVCDDRPAFDIVMDVPERAQVNIAGVQGSFDRDLGVDRIDFGTLRANQSREAFVQVRANAPVRVSVTSESGGTLRSEDGAYKVPYRASLDGQDLALETMDQTVLPAATDQRGVSLPLLLTIGDPSGNPSGRYTDLIIIEVSPL